MNETELPSLSTASLASSTRQRSYSITCFMRTYFASFCGAKIVRLHASVGFIFASHQHKLRFARLASKKKYGCLVQINWVSLYLSFAFTFPFRWWLAMRKTLLNFHIWRSRHSVARSEPCNWKILAAAAAAAIPKHFNFRMLVNARGRAHCA